MIEILRAHNVSQAHALRTALEAVGIEAQVHGEHAPYVSDISVVVTNPVDAPRAFAILKEMEQSKPH